MVTNSGVPVLLWEKVTFFYLLKKTAGPGEPGPVSSLFLLIQMVNGQ